MGITFSALFYVICLNKIYNFRDIELLDMQWIPAHYWALFSIALSYVGYWYLCTDYILAADLYKYAIEHWSEFD